MRYQRHCRAGFTLVEMMVATALTLVIMLIITQAFASASKTFTTLRTAGYMQERLRTGINIMRKDLGSDHFAPPYGSSRSGPHLSDQRLDQAGWVPPRQGYFEISQNYPAQPDPTEPIPPGWPFLLPPSSTIEPFMKPVQPSALSTDGEGLTSTRADFHVMRFTVRLPDGPATELFAARFSSLAVPGVFPGYTNWSTSNAFVNGQGILYSRWAEVAYFLWKVKDDGSANQFGYATTKADGTGLYRYTLRRRVRLLPERNVISPAMPTASAQQIVADCANYANDVIQPILIQTSTPGFSILMLPGPEYLNQNPTNRIQAVPHPTGDDIVATDVTSMDIKAAWFDNPTLASLGPQFPSQAGQTLSTPDQWVGVGPFTCSPPSYKMVAPAGAMPNMDEPFSDLPPSVLQTNQGQFLQRRFDTGYQTSLQDQIDWDNPLPLTGGNPQNGFLTNVPNVNPVPSRINIRALQIKLRVWDPRAEQARQATIVSEV